MADIEKIAEDLSNLTVLEAAELATLLEEKWGVSAAAAPMAMAMPAGGGDAGGAQKKRLNLMLFWPLPAHQRSMSLKKFGPSQVLA